MEVYLKETLEKEEANKLEESPKEKSETEIQLH